MKKKQSKKKTQNKKKKNYSEATAFANLENTSIPVSKPKRSSSGIPKYVADRMAKRISKLSDHLQGNIHDFASRQGLLKMIGQRKRLLSYVKEKNVQRYQELIKKIGIRG